MRRKISKEIKFIQIQVTEEAHQIIVENKTRNKPIYAVVDDILDKYQQYKDYKDMYETHVELTKRWKQRYDDLYKKVSLLESIE